MSEDASASTQSSVPATREEGELPSERATASSSTAVGADRGGGHHAHREESPGTSSEPAPRHRRTHRRATGGSTPDAERALGGADWGDTAQGLGADTPDPAEDAAAAGHEQWLREQRPPHWG